MASITYINTAQVEEKCNKIIELVNDYDVEINNLFKRMSEVPFVTKEWFGKTAVKYVGYVLMDKSSFTETGNVIRSYAKKMISDSDKINTEVRASLSRERSGL